MLIDPYAGAWETRNSSRGIPYQVWQPTMPWIAPQLLECTVYLYPSEAEAEDGKAIGGTGFLVSMPVGTGTQKTRLICIVTNKHVIESGNMTARLNTVTGGIDIIPLDGEKWFLHPEGDDLAVCPIRLSTCHSYTSVPMHLFVDDNAIEHAGIGPGDDVFIIGRFINHEGKQRNLPSLRFGNIAQMPWEPIVVDGHAQQSFLVEARSISGYSGSPVFAFAPPSAALHPELLKAIQDGKLSNPLLNMKRVNMSLPIGPYLLGIDYCHIRWDEPIWNKHTERPVNDDWFVKSNTGMMGVVPAWRLKEVLEGPEMKPVVDAAKEAAKKAKAKDTPVELDIARATKSEPISTEDNPSHEADFNRLLDAAAQSPKSTDQT